MLSCKFPGSTENKSCSLIEILTAFELSHVRRRKAPNRQCCQIVIFWFLKVIDYCFFECINLLIKLPLKYLFLLLFSQNFGNAIWQPCKHLTTQFFNYFSNKSGSLFRMTNLHNQLLQQVFSFFLLLPNNDRCHTFHLDSNTKQRRR